MQLALCKSADPVETSVVRFIRTRLQMTHEEQGICVLSGPWGIGKTTAIECFAKNNCGRCVVVKIEQGSMARGASPVFVLQQTIEAIRPLIGRPPRATLSNAYWSLRLMLYNCIRDWLDADGAQSGGPLPPLSIIFDEAQYLSRDAIEMLRFWNDTDRTVTPVQVGLMFVGNSEFVLQENSRGDSVLSGAVRSRSLFIEALTDQDVSDDDIALYLRSRGEYQTEALSLMLDYFRQPKVRRDFRSIKRIDDVLRRKSPNAPIIAENVRALLG